VPKSYQWGKLRSLLEHATLHFIEAKSLKKYFLVEKGLIAQLFPGTTQYVKAEDGVSFERGRGDIFGLVGESGIEKSAKHKIYLKSA